MTGAYILTHDVSGELEPLLSEIFLKARRVVDENLEQKRAIRAAEKKGS